MKIPETTPLPVASHVGGQHRRQRESRAMPKLVYLLLLFLALQEVRPEEAEVLDLDIAPAPAAEVDEGLVGSPDDKTIFEEPPVEDEIEENSASVADEVASDNAHRSEMNAAMAEEEVSKQTSDSALPPVQSGPFIDLFGPTLLSLEMLDETHAQLTPQYTNDALRGKKVIGLYFSADWCGPCRQFTPELTSFYEKINKRRGRKDEFEIVWVSRCRDTNSYGQYFTQMGRWLALPPEEAMGQRGAWLGDKYKVKSIPTLVLLDDLGNVITRDGRNKIPQDKAGIGFPWRNPLSTLYMTVIPRSVRLMIKSQIVDTIDGIKRLARLKKAKAKA